MAQQLLFIINHNQKEEVQEDKGYIEVNDVVCDNEYCTITITGIYPKDEEWKSISEYLPIEYEVENKTDEVIYVDFMLNTYNGIGYNWNNAVTSLCVNEKQIGTNRVGDGFQLDTIRSNIGKQDFIGGRLALRIYKVADDYSEIELYRDEFDYYPFGEESYVEWDISELIATGKEVLNNDELKVTFLGYYAYQSDSARDIMFFCVENQSSEGITLNNRVDDDEYSTGQGCYIPVGGEAIYAVYTPDEKYDLSNMDNIKVDFIVTSGTNGFDISEDGMETQRYPIEVELFPYARELYPDGD